MTAMLASQIALWIAVLALSVMVLALARQIGVLHARIAPMGALKVDNGTTVGQPAPRFTVQTLNAGPVQIGFPALAGTSQLLLFVSPDCPVCKTLIPVARAFASDERLSVVYVGDGADADLLRLIEKHDLQKVPVANSPETGIRFGVGKLPYAVLIDEQGIVAAAGLVNSREHLESLVVAQQMGVPSVQVYLQRRQNTADAGAPKQS